MINHHVRLVKVVQEMDIVLDQVVPLGASALQDGKVKSSKYVEHFSNYI